MTDEYSGLISSYTKSMKYQSDNYLRQFSRMIYFNSVMDLSLNKSSQLSEYGCSYAVNMRATIQILMFKISTTKYSIFSDLLRFLADYYFQSKKKNNGKPFYRLTIDCIEFMNMLDKEHVPFLDDVL